MSRARNPLQAANAGGPGRFLLDLLVILGYATALFPLGSWGAHKGPQLTFRVAWILALLIFACARTWLKRKESEHLHQQLGVLLLQILPGTLLGWLIGCATIGFDNMGFGPFLGLMVCLGIGSALLGQILRHLPGKGHQNQDSGGLGVNGP